MSSAELGNLEKRELATSNKYISKVRPCLSLLVSFLISFLISSLFSPVELTGIVWGGYRFETPHGWFHLREGDFCKSQSKHIIEHIFHHNSARSKVMTASMVRFFAKDLQPYKRG